MAESTMFLSDYSATRPELVALYAKSKVHNWNAEDLPWSLDVDPEGEMFRRLLFSKIVPNVKRLGLLTPRVRTGFQELDILDYESWEPSA